MGDEFPPRRAIHTRSNRLKLRNRINCEGCKSATGAVAILVALPSSMVALVDDSHTTTNSLQHAVKGSIPVGGVNLARPPNFETSEQHPSGDPTDHASGWTTSLSHSFRQLAAHIQDTLANVNLVGSLSLLAALVSFWFDFRGGYTITRNALNDLSPVGAGLLPSILIAMTVFMTVWFLLYGWRYAITLRAKLDPDSDAKSQLKKIAPDIENCLFFVGELRRVEEQSERQALMEHIGDSCVNLCVALQDMGIDGPTTYKLGLIGPDHYNQQIDAEGVQRLLSTLAPLARRGNVRDARRAY